MRRLLILTVLFEGLAGLILLVYPSIAIRLLFSSEMLGTGVLMSRLTGISLIGLAVSCWPDHNPLRALFGMMTYNLLATLFLVYVGISGAAGILLWPAFAAHSGLSLLLVGAWRKERRQRGKNPGSEAA